MTQIKLFNIESRPEVSTAEKEVNMFLAENEGKIVVKEIKYEAVTPNPNNTIWKNWTFMVVYETL